MSAASKPQGAAASSEWLRRELVATFALSWPIVLANVAINAMTATDFMMLGWLAPHALAAGALGFNLYMPAFLLGVGVVGALAPIAAAKIGSGEKSEGLRRATHQAFLSALASPPSRGSRCRRRQRSSSPSASRPTSRGTPEPTCVDSSGVSRRASCFSPAVRCSSRSSVPVRRSSPASSPLVSTPSPTTRSSSASSARRLWASSAPDSRPRCRRR